MKNDIFYLDENRDIIVYLLADVTEIFEQERQSRGRLETALTAAEQASVAKTEFLSRMSHEIRTPMNAIIGLDAIALQEKNLSTSMTDHLQKIGISARFLLALINDILDMSRIESGRLALKNELFGFEEMVGSINTILYEQCRDNGLEYECILKSYTEETYTGDVTKLQQVLINLLGNAVKFTPRGGKIHFMIEQLSRTKEKARLRFEIADTGIGIDEKFLPHIFEPFSQENRGRTSAYGGTGLGLAISKNIVGMMNGDITVHSIKNIGSEFTVEVELGLTRDSIRRRELGQNLRPLFTLIVDDEIIVCQHTQMILNEAGLKTEYVDSGSGAVQKVETQHRVHDDYDLVLLDWKMPDMDGIETAREIRKIVGPEITIIIMTAYDWADIEKKARAAGVDLFMKKPIFASSVTKAFENVFLRKQASAEPEERHDFDFIGKKILLAEDNVINAEIACNLLQMKGCEVELVVNGAEAVEAFAAAPIGRFDAILMDVRMPVMDGLEATRAIRAMRKADAKTIPILAMTANAFQEDAKQSMEAGMNAHLTKPIEPVTLYETLKRGFEKAEKKMADDC
jgi:signal transduction histidine kinase/CheY-like chemotaxis protein